MSDSKTRRLGLGHFVAISVALHLILILAGETPQFGGRVPAEPQGRIAAKLAAHRIDADHGDRRAATPAALAEAQRPVKETPVRGGRTAHRPHAVAGYEGNRQASEQLVGVEHEAGARAATVGVSQDALRQYVLQLAPEARRHKVYPAVAQENGWEGSVEVSIAPATNGPGPLLSVSRSSGRAELDAQALTTMTAAVRAVPLPEALKGRDLAIPVTVEFRLRD